jgi:hypothetical protein
MAFQGKQFRYALIVKRVDCFLQPEPENEVVSS